MSALRTELEWLTINLTKSMKIYISSTQHIHVVHWDCSGFQNNRFSTGLQQGAFLVVDKNKVTMYDTSNHNEHINIKNGNNIIIRPFGLVISFKKWLLASSRC